MKTRASRWFAVLVGIGLVLVLATARPLVAAEAATPVAAAKVLDLRTFPRIKGAAEGAQQSLGQLMYEAPAAPTPAFEFQKKQLTAAGWREQPGGYHDASNHSAQFSKAGYLLTVSTSAMTGEPGKDGWSRVSLTNHGNVAAAKLPVPKDAKPQPSFGGGASYLTKASVADTAAACRKLLEAAGWVPYGAAGDETSPMMYFKQNAIRLLAWVSAAPAQGNQTMIRYSTELLSADLPVPPDAPDPRYEDSEQTLSFDYPGEDSAPVVKFYQAALDKLGWKATTEQPVADNEKRSEFMIFRNAADDLIALDLRQFNEIVRVKVDFDTAAEVAAKTQREKAAALAKIAADKEAAKVAKSQPKPAGVEMPELPDTDDVGSLIKAAEKMAADALDEAKQAVQSPAGAARSAGTAKTPVATVNVADLPLPEGAGVEFSKITKMIKVTSGSDVATLARFFTESLGEQGWQAAPNPLITDDSAILKFSRGASTITIMADGEAGGSNATLMTKGLNWDKTPANRASAAPAKRDAADNAAEMPAEDRPAESEEAETPPARLRYAAKIAPADQKQSGASLRAGGRAFPLTYGVAYERRDGDEIGTEVLLSVKPVPVDKLVALLNSGQDGGDALSFDPQLKLRYDAAGKLDYLFLYAEGLSVNLGGQGEDTVQAELTIDGDRARGKAHLVKPGKLFDKEYTFTAPFDVVLIKGSAAAPTDPSTPAPTEPLGAEERDGLPYPLIAKNRSSSGTPFRRTVEVSIPAPLAAVVEFYRRELSARGWKEDAAAAQVAGDKATLSFAGPEGTIALALAGGGDDVNASLDLRNPARAKAAGIVAQPNKGRLILGNAGDREAVIIINGQPYKVPAGRGAKQPQDGISLHVLPGNYSFTVKDSKVGDDPEKLKIAVGETWGIVVLPTGGYFANRVY